MRIGTAGWVIPRQSAEMAAGEGSHLERHARVFRCVEINSSFHRSHRPATWARWAEAVWSWLIDHRDASRPAWALVPFELRGS